MPALSPTMETGNLPTWRIKQGDEINPGTVMADVETDKAVVDFEVGPSSSVLVVFAVLMHSRL
jgi:pyruvate/2-oxoglutarate dehydrogenase complex dihydrolipoamide acyltransferase (E2) component